MTHQRAEFEKAKEQVEKMRSSQSLDELEAAWKEYLHRLERVWTKSEAYFKENTKWGNWSSSYRKLRKQDPLLVYLIHARGAEEHTVKEIVARTGGYTTVNPAHGNTLYIEHMEISNGVITKLKSPNARVDFYPARVQLLPIVNRGVKYPVPVLHLGKAINPQNIISIAEAALAFYDNFLQKAEAFSDGA